MLSSTRLNKIFYNKIIFDNNWQRQIVSMAIYWIIVRATIITSWYAEVNLIMLLKYAC